MPTIIPEPFSLSEAKLYMRIDDDYTYDDDIINTLIKAERMAMEKQLELSLVSKNGLVYKYQRKCCGQRSLTNIPFGPVTSIVITDFDGNVLDPVPTNVGSDEFPQYYFMGSVNVTYDAGYTDSNIPADIKLALLMNVATAYENRENSTTSTNNEVINNARQLMRPNSRNVF